MGRNYTYGILKMTARKVFHADFDLELKPSQLIKLLINEPDNGYFGIIRKITNNTNYLESTDAKNPAFMDEVIFIDCSYNNIVYNRAELRWAIKQDIANKKDLKKIKANLEKMKLTDEVIKKIEKIDNSLQNFQSIYGKRKKKNIDVAAYEENLDTLLRYGFSLNEKKYLLVGMSGSMARHGIKGFVSDDIYEEVMDYSYLIEKPEKCKIPKYEAYRNLLFTSCRAYVDELPRICVVEDYFMTIPNVAVKYPADGFYVTYEENGEVKKKIPRKVMKSDTINMEINCFDGSAIHSSEYNNVLYMSLSNTKSIPKSYQLRLPYFKGLSTCFDIKGFCKEKGIIEIKDIDGNMHPYDEVDMLVTRSMYKGADFFNTFAEYYAALKEKGYKLGISNYSKSSQECSEYSKANYQYLQNISALTKDDLIGLSKYFTNYVDEVLKNPCTALKFLNIDSDIAADDSDEQENISNKTPYTLQALQICPEMAKDECVRASVSNLVKNSIKQAKYGRILLKGGYKYLVPDLCMLMCWVGKNSGYDIKVTSSLQTGEMYCSGKSGTYSVFRSPQLLENEINVVNLINDDTTDRWYKHLDNILVTNSCSMDMMRMQTSDYDGDSAYLCEEKLITDKIKTGLPLIINNGESKPPVLEYNEDNKVDYHKKTLDCLIGQITNKSCSLHNKTNKKATTNQFELDGVIDETRVKVAEDLEYLSIQIQLETDFVKSGIRWDTPYDIDRNSAELPYFMQYRYDKLGKEVKKMNAKRNAARNSIIKKNGYESKDKYISEKINDKTRLAIKNKLSEKKYRLPVSCSKTPLNELCQYLEKWSPIMRFRLKSEDVSARFLPDGIIENIGQLELVRCIYNRYLAECKEFIKKKKSVNWNCFYNTYKIKFLEICDGEKELLYYLIKICYANQEDKKKKVNKSIIWNLCGETIIEILKERNVKIDRNNSQSNEPNKATA